jgi:hypothetical protein
LLLWNGACVEYEVLSGPFLDNLVDGCRAADFVGDDQVLRTTFPAIRESVRLLIGERMDKLARQFAATHDLKVKAELERLNHEHRSLSAPWVFISH